jgi:diguanylate cyclase (GGDEF)-like protein
MKDEDGTVIGAVEIFSEISEPSRLMEELESLRNEILIDKQTGLGNRRYLEIVQGARVSALERTGSRLGLLFLDIDRFKSVNDTWGHKFGDQILRMVGLTLKGAIRPNESAIRFGGEEFVVLSPDCDATKLRALAECIRALVEMAWLDEGEKKIGVTVSIGGSLMSAGENFDERLAKADALMYECKNSGRNRVRVES